jgi:membrane associated rhomboid family serine protease
MSQSIIATLIIIATFLTTYQGEKDRWFKEEYIFWTDGILIRKEWQRMFTSGFLHSGWWHFGFNMVTLFSFSYSLEYVFGMANFTLIYFASLLGGSLLALYFHRNHGDYKALGASGAVSGVIMASIVLMPSADLQLLFIPYGIPAWVLGAVFIAVSIFGIKAQADNIGHDAHLGGAIVGTLMACALKPQLAIDHWWVVLMIIVPCSVFIYIVVKNPAILFIEGYWGEEVHAIKTYKLKSKKKLSLDELLDKINAGGIESLSSKEKKLLDEYQKDM